MDFTWLVFCSYTPYSFFYCPVRLPVRSLEMKQNVSWSIYNPLPLAESSFQFLVVFFNALSLLGWSFFFKTMRKPLRGVLTVGNGLVFPITYPRQRSP